MVRLYYLAVIQRQPLKSVILCNASDLKGFNFFQKGSVKEFMRFCSTTLVGRIELETKVSVKEQTYMCHAFVRKDGLAAAAVTDDEYPAKVAHICLSQLLEDFSFKILPKTWNTNEAVRYPEIKELLEKFEDPKSTDVLGVIQAELEETKVILHQTMETILQRGEKLDDLVIKADDLSIQAKTFYKTAKKTNACCSAL
ncbi:synaptobrevin homolog YKT6-like [Stegodyphus dumicola]|uniref:synaptobrevin homolog YKT6-like n=1 Tax=Stegodyphus dumicola TaxID=202533 RepID=UPI0015AD27C7|nr:synaptobrevin homolog YKT6-like [Stegodyphus dumicola]